MSESETGRLTMRHIRRLVKFVVLGSAIFTLMMLVLQGLLDLAGRAPDPTVYNFYPIMAALGAAFGAERWWAHEQGPYNPFHDK